jgi:SAM-dependent methyltransferase
VIAVRIRLNAAKPTDGGCDDRRMTDPGATPHVPGPPDKRTRIVGRALNASIARAPFLWPLLRRPFRRFWDDRAPSWGERVDRSGALYLTPLAAALVHVRPEPERAIDIGTGLGDGALLIAREFPQARVRGVDISEEMIRRAQARIGLDPEGRVAFKVADAAALPYDDDSFDLAAQLNMPPFFAEIARVLRPGGYAVIASSWGPDTPFYTPHGLLGRRFRRVGLETLETGAAGKGTYFIARLPQ